MALPELLANSPVPGIQEPVGTIVSGELTVGGASFTLSQKLPKPLREAGQCRLLIDNELMLVEGGSSTTITILERGVEETTATSHAANAKVYHVPSAEGIRKWSYPKLVSALPGSPTDGQEVYFQNTNMGENGEMWHLRYRSGSGSTHKWEFVGGSHILRVNTGGTARETAGSNVAFINPDCPVITVPLAGDYDFFVQCLMINNTSETFLSLKIAEESGVVISPETFRLTNQQSGYKIGTQFTMSGGGRVTGITAGAKVTIALVVETEKAKVNMFGPLIEMRPVRLG